MKDGRERWDIGSMPRMDGKTVIVTGATSGIGRQLATTLSAMGAHVVLAARDMSKAKEVADGICDEVGSPSLEPIPLDLADIGSVGDFITSFKMEHDSLDVLINNAGVMIPPFTRTAQGYELQWGVNHLGHFALTGLLIDHLISTPGSRVVTQTSMAHWNGDIDFSDINSNREYQSMKAYQQSKLANLLFARGLQRRLESVGLDNPTSIASHPGVSNTSLFRHHRFMNLLVRPLMQGPGRGSLPALRAATDPDASGGELYGPSGITEFRGFPVKVAPRNRGNDDELGDRVWELSEEMTGVPFMSHIRSAVCNDGSCTRR